MVNPYVQSCTCISFVSLHVVYRVVGLKVRAVVTVPLVAWAWQDRPLLRAI
jgi:hypothetical protein